MDLDDSLSAAIRVLRRRPTEVLPPFLADSALTVVVQLTLVAGALGVLAVRGVERFRRLFESLGGLVPPVTDAELAAVEAALADVLTPTAVAILAATALVAAVLGVLVRAAAGAAKVHAALAATSDGDPPTAAVGGVLADAWTFVWLTLLQVALFVGPLLVGAAGPLVVGGETGLAILGLAVLLWLPLALAGYFLLLFVPEAVVVEGVGLWAAVRRNLSYLGDHPGRAVVFGLLELGTLFVVGGVGSAFDALGVGRITTLFALFLAFPFLGLVKMGLYVEPGQAGVPAADHRGGPEDRAGGTGAVDEQWGDDAVDERWGTDPDRGDPGVEDRGGGDRGGGDREFDDTGAAGTGTDGPGRRSAPVRQRPRPRPGPAADPEPDVGGESLLADLRSVLARSVAELRGFLADRPGLVAVSLAAFLAGVGGGYWVGTATGIELVTRPPTADVFGAFPLDVAVNLTANNWGVAIAQAYAGVAFGVPVLGNLAFNGAIVGGLAGLGFDLATFAALVVPHGVIEIPALAVGGAVGLYMAGRGWALFRGRTSAQEAGTALRRAFLVLVGLLPVFVVAGFVEAFLTPAIAELLVG